MKIIPFTLWACCLFPLLVYSQNTPHIDSLLHKLDGTSDQESAFQLSAQLWSAYINHDIRAAAAQADRIIDIGKVLERDTILSFGYEKKGITYAYQGQFDSSDIFFRKALKLNQKLEDYERMASVQRNIGQDYAMVGELDSAFLYYQKAAESFARIGDSVGMAEIYNSEAVVYYAKGFYRLAFDRAVAGEKIFEKHEDLALDLNQNQLVIGSIFAAMKDTLNAIRYMQKTIDYFVANDLPRQYASTGALLTSLQIPDYQSYPELDQVIDKMIAHSTALEDPALRAQVQLCKAELEYARENYALARAIQAELVEETAAAENYIQQMDANLGLGKTSLALRDYSIAIENLKTAERLSEQFSISITSRDAKKLLAEAYEQTGDYRNSLTYYQAYKVLDEQIYTEERVNRFNELQTIYETEKKESALALQAEKIKTLDAQVRNDRLTSTLYAIGMIVFLLISGLLFFGFRQKMKRNRLEREQQEATFRQEIAFKKKELTSQTLHLVQKNTFLRELSEKLTAIKQSPESFRAEFPKLSSLLQRQADEDATWEVFKSYFSQVHNDFDTRLKSAAEELTENDVRLASFLRMNLTTKEIASLLNVLPDSVLKSKYRLKKKIGLDKEQDLGEYLNGL